jgi:hypothetical protein
MFPIAPIPYALPKVVLFHLYSWAKGGGTSPSNRNSYVGEPPRFQFCLWWEGKKKWRVELGSHPYLIWALHYCELLATINFCFSLCFHMISNNSSLFMSMSNLIWIIINIMELKWHMLIGSFIPTSVISIPWYHNFTCVIWNDTFFLPKPGFLEFIWIFSGRNHLKINQDISNNTKGTFQFLLNFQLRFNLIFSDKIIQYLRTFALQVQTSPTYLFTYLLALSPSYFPSL